MRRAWALGALAPVLLTAGAWSQEPFGRERDKQAELRAIAAAWPARVGPAGHPGARGVIRAVDAPDGLAGFQPSPMRAGVPSEADKQDAIALIGDRPVQFEGAGSFLFGKARPPAPSSRPPATRPVAREFFKFVSAESTARGDEQAPARIQRTWFALYVPDETDDPRGLALVMPGLFNTPEPVIEYVVRTLQTRGWVVLRMMAQPSRFTERLAFSIDPEHLDLAAARIAEVMQDRAAECSYSVQAAFAHVLEEHPQWAKLPRVAVGMSGGAMTLPTVVALEPEKYAAAVLIAGGDDFLTIALESNYRFIVDAMTFDWTNPPTPAQIEQLERLYREKAPLDSLHTAAALVGKPILMLHATHDGAVPAHLGDELWERLGRPQRWSEEAGHEEIFMRLPQKAGRICDWLAEKTAAKPGP